MIARYSINKNYLWDCFLNKTFWLAKMIDANRWRHFPHFSHILWHAKKTVIRYPTSFWSFQVDGITGFRLEHHVLDQHIELELGVGGEIVDGFSDLTAVLLSGTGGSGQHSWRDFNPLDGPRIVPSPVTNLQNSSNKYTVVHMY